MPYICLDEIIPWLMHRQLWPDIPDRKIKRYWNHIKEVKSDISDVSPDGCHHPLWVWGDAANYSKDQNIIVICFGSVLDDETDSIRKCFPLVLCREEPWMHWAVHLFNSNLMLGFMMISLGLPILPHCSLMVLRAWPRRWAVDLKLSERTWNLSLVCKKSVLYWSGGSGERSA